MDTNTCPACGLNLGAGDEVTFALPHIGNLKTGEFTPSGDREARVHTGCVGKVGRGDLLWKAIDPPD